MLLINEFLYFLKHRIWWWVLPIVALFAGLLWLAWKVSLTPANPFIYRI
ncbi:MAG: hypothetical protein JNM84_16595 [Planctomycetes bacterium]|nr:hypothetical protein [Planctomycetota bacterium]